MLVRIHERDNPGEAPIHVIQKKRPQHLVQVTRRQLLHDDDPPQTCLLALARMHCACVAHKFQFAGRCVFFESELTPKAVAAKPFPMILHKREHYHVHFRGASVKANDATQALAIWLHAAPATIDGRFDIRSI